MSNLPLPRRRYTVILADPPWRYSHSRSESRRVENHYATMDIDDIKALPVAEIAAKSSVLYLWATAPKLLEALDAMKAWGFEYKTQAAWDKELMGPGYWFRGQHELLLLGTRGSISPPPPPERVPSVIRARRRRHSEKPDEAYLLIERGFPSASKVELFARARRPGWDAWGLEVRGAA